MAGTSWPDATAGLDKHNERDFPGSTLYNYCNHLLFLMIFVVDCFTVVLYLALLLCLCFAVQLCIQYS